MLKKKNPKNLSIPFFQCVVHVGLLETAKKQTNKQNKRKHFHAKELEYKINQYALNMEHIKVMFRINILENLNIMSNKTKNILLKKLHLKKNKKWETVFLG